MNEQEKPKQHDPKLLFEHTVDGVFMKHQINVFGYHIDLKDQKSDRRAEIYTNAHDGIHFGVCLKDRLRHGQGGTLLGERWQGGYCIGFNFDLATAYEHAMAFVKSDTVPGKS